MGLIQIAGYESQSEAFLAGLHYLQKETKSPHRISGWIFTGQGAKFANRPEKAVPAYFTCRVVDVHHTLPSMYTHNSGAGVWSRRTQTV